MMGLLAVLLVVIFAGQHQSFTVRGVVKSHLRRSLITSTAYSDEKSAYESLQLLDPEMLSLLSSCIDNNNDTPFVTAATEIADSLSEWSNHLVKGCMPEEVDWPTEPLLSEIKTTFTKLKLPLLTMRHPELIPSVSKGLLSLYFEYNTRVQEEVDRRERILQEEEVDEVEDEYTRWYNAYTASDVHDDLQEQDDGE